VVGLKRFALIVVDMLNRIIELLKQINELENKPRYSFLIPENGDIFLVLISGYDIEQMQILGNLIDLSSVETRLIKKIKLSKKMKKNSEQNKRTLFGE
jgi:hypothetical protein